MIKVGLIGAGFMGRTHAQCYAALPNAELVAVADVRKENAKEVAKETGAKAFPNADALIANADVDMVDICLPTFLHAEYTIKAAQKGLHILCEKPIALNVKEAEAMLRAADKAKVKFMVAQVIRFWPEYMVLRDWIKTKKLGKLISLNCTRVSPRPTWGWQNWLNKAAKSGSALVDLHIHDVDFIRYILGDPIEVDAYGTQSKGGWEHIFAVYTYPKKVSASAEGGWNFPASYPFKMAFSAVFAKGAIEFDSRCAQLAVYPEDGEPLYPEIPTIDLDTGDRGGNLSDIAGYFNEIQYFVNCLEKNEHPKIVTAVDARDSLALAMKELKIAEAHLKKTDKAAVAKKTSKKKAKKSSR